MRSAAEHVEWCPNMVPNLKRALGERFDSFEQTPEEWGEFVRRHCEATLLPELMRERRRYQQHREGCRAAAEERKQKRSAEEKMRKALEDAAGEYAGHIRQLADEGGSTAEVLARALECNLREKDAVCAAALALVIKEPKAWRRR